jgi:1-hydroxycarotenoid 3,4-desaturase
VKPDHIAVVGAGVGGLTAAIDLARQGLAVTVLERASAPGGKMREVAGVDAGPTVLTMRFVFDELFAAAGASFDGALKLKPLPILARHAWGEGERFDLHADLKASTEAVAAFAGRAEAERFKQFAADARTIYRTLKDTYLTEQRPNPVSLANRIGFHRPGALLAIRPFDTLWRALGTYFHDPRLRQLFARYATYGGSSPFLSPATLMLIAHVEQQGVWTIDGGMQRLAEALAKLATRTGCRLRFNAHVAAIDVRAARAHAVRLASGETIEADAVVLNADAAALAQGLFGSAARTGDSLRLSERSLSAMTWSIIAETQGFPLDRHNVFFSTDYAREFETLFAARKMPADPTVYVCAQDRGHTAPKGRERLLILINAPATGDTSDFSQEIETCETNVFQRLNRSGLTLRNKESTVTTPADFHRLFPGTGGALYGRATHGWMASFQRPEAKTAIANLYLAGGSTHPGAGVPMAALSGKLAARRLIADSRSTRTSRPAATFGGTLMR